jgi:hypothetical protein
MGAVNAAIIEIVEAVLVAKDQLQNELTFAELMNNLMVNTKKFWDEHKDVIPVQYHIFFKKCE